MKSLFNLDLQKIKQSNDISMLNQILENLVYGFIDKEELNKYGDDVFITMVKTL